MAACYALELDPALVANDFRIVSVEMSGDTPKVEWEPKTNRRALTEGLSSPYEGLLWLAGDGSPYRQP